jgi:hypothetical protein
MSNRIRKGYERRMAAARQEEFRQAELQSYHKQNQRFKSENLSMQRAGALRTSHQAKLAYTLQVEAQETKQREDQV